ncbi:exported protein of unknown function [Micropruina glycogenica]|uniref:Uncharacterized protein n=1 Tax=Micropruina glycogenica TaxID=75385 RepID=A0A2N9JG64_9ACTN|nr:exported protein of unknown function [Micropruina glycogenica]
MRCRLCSAVRRSRSNRAASRASAVSGSSTSNRYRDKARKSAALWVSANPTMSSSACRNWSVSKSSGRSCNTCVIACTCSGTKAPAAAACATIGKRCSRSPSITMRPAARRVIRTASTNHVTVEVPCSCTAISPRSISAASADSHAVRRASNRTASANRSSFCLPVDSRTRPSPRADRAASITATRAASSNCSKSNSMTRGYAARLTVSNIRTVIHKAFRDEYRLWTT